MRLSVNSFVGLLMILLPNIRCGSPTIENPHLRRTMVINECGESPKCQFA